MRTLDFLRGANYEGYNAFVKAFYDESDAHPISEKCLGDWMNEDFDNLYPVIKKLMKGHWYDVSFEEAKAAVDGALNMFYINKNECKFNYIRNDMIKTCLDNTDQCIFLSNKLGKEQTFESLMPLLSKGFDLFQLFMADDTCFSDQQLIDEYQQLWADIGSIVRELTGFEGQLDLTKK